MPCRRDMDIDALDEKILKIYKQCKTQRGILITLPEHRLSFQLKIYDLAHKGLYEKAASLLRIHDWLHKNCRHILDESDAILQPNYQLIYSVGAQLPLDGNELRWTCIQAILKQVPHHMYRLYKRFGDQKIVFAEKYTCDDIDFGSGGANTRPEVFRPCRLLDADLYNILKMELAYDFIHRRLAISFPEMTEALKVQVYAVLVDNALSKSDLESYLKHFDLAPRQTVMILSGLLKFEVLRMALTNRWRVNYGRNAHETRKMAVPYKAKDVAAELTEFGHPDVAICLTHLSYYYSGLNDVELHDVFRHLDLSENPNDAYAEFVRHVPADKLHESIKSYSGVNLFDAKQRTEYLFPVLRRNMYVIDYWLSQKVFPHEAKMFDSKLMCTAWDLCSHNLQHPVTGFSGTNDTKSLLPLPIVQSDLPELETTNENVRQTLMGAENEHYHMLSSNTSGMDILERLTQKKIPVLIDAGALMLELNNAQVATKWLDMVSREKFDAAVYFSESDIMLTVDRKGFVIEFENSVYREQLQRCVVYLDDVHTRGTDLKFPRNVRACVTLCGGITRDKTVQACMRMRMLGSGHQIAFWASHEADVGIREMCKKSNSARITTDNVIEYVTDNSRQFNENGMRHWTNGVQNYVKKYAAHEYVKTHAELPPAKLMEELGDRCADKENLSLMELYGAKEVARLTQVASTAFASLKIKYDEEDAVVEWITHFDTEIRKKLRKDGHSTQIYTQFLDDEYEKELEYELELQQQVCRPQMRTPMKPHFNPLLATFFTNTDARWRTFAQLKLEQIIYPLPMALRNTHMFASIRNEVDAWSKSLWVTDDFNSAVQSTENDKDDEYLRPIWWIVHIEDQPPDDACPDGIYILISSYECNKLLKKLRPLSSASKVTLHMFNAKLSQSQPTLIHNIALQTPHRTTPTQIPMNILVQLSAFAGSTYFSSDEEQSAYCEFIGTIPAPRTDEQQQAFEAGYISSTGFVQKRHRHNFPTLDEKCRFNESPTNFIIKNIERRHGSVPKRSHAGQLLYEAKRPRLDEDANDQNPMSD